MEEFVNKLVVTCKKPKRTAKALCKQLRRILLPNVTYKLKDKNVSVRKYKAYGDELKMCHFIVVGDTYVRIGKRPDGPTLTCKIEEYDGKMASLQSSYYTQDPLITISGDSDIASTFTSLARPPKVPVRTIHFHFEGDKIEMRHYKIETQEEEDIKVGLTEVGPKLTLKIVKTQEGFFPND